MVDPFTNALFAGRYRLEDKLGEGGSATVYLASELNGGNQHVAIKLVDAPELLQHELGVLLCIDHPHIAKALDFGSHTVGQRQHRFLATELCAGKPAQTWAVSRSVQQVAHVGAQIAAALSALHAHRVRHGDVKPHNIIVSEEVPPIAKLVDFGLATASGGSGQAAGTPVYMAPESLEGAATFASDVYGLAATLYHMANGAAPPPGQLHRVLSTAPLDKALAALGHPDPGRRSSAKEAFALLAALAELPPDLQTLQARPLDAFFPFGQHPLQTRLNTLLKSGGSRRLVVCGVPGSGKTAALTWITAHAIMAGRDVPGMLRVGASGSLECLEQALAYDAEHGAPEPAGVLQNRWQLYGHWASLLARRAQRRPLTLVFDDVPSDSLLGGLGEFLERLGEDGPNLLWVESRVQGDDQSAAHCALQPLAREEVPGMLEACRPLAPVAAPVCDALYHASGGNPGCIMTLLRRYPGDLLEEATRGHAHLEVPNVEAVWLDLLRAMDESAQRCLSAIALLQPPVPLELLQSVPGLAGTLEQDMAASVQHGILRRISTTRGPEVSVPHEALRRHLENATTSELMHALEAALDTHRWRDVRAADLGHLRRRLGLPQKAKGPLLQAARRAHAAFALDAALVHYDTLLSLADLDDTLRRQICVESAPVLQAFGNSEGALARLEAAWPHPESRLATAEMLITGGKYREAANLLAPGKPPIGGEDVHQATALYVRALAFAGEHELAAHTAQEYLNGAPSDEQLPQIHETLGLLAYFQGMHAKAVQQLRTAAELAERHLGNVTLQERIRANLAMALHKSGDLRAAEIAYTESLKAAQRTHNLPRQLSRLSNLATLQQERGCFADALASFEQAFRLAQLVDGQREAVYLRLNWGNLLLWLGQVGNAKAHIEAVLHHCEVLGMDVELGYAHLLAAELALAEGAGPRSERHISAAQMIFENTKHYIGRIEADVIRAEWELHTGAFAKAFDLACATAALAKKAGRPRLQAQALCFAALAAYEEPRQEALAVAHELVALAESLGDPDLGSIAHAAVGKLQQDRRQLLEAQFHIAKARQLAAAAKARLSAHMESTYRQVWYRKKLWEHLSQEQDERAPATLNGAYNVDGLLAILRELAQDHDPDRLLERIIDAAIALSGAERGFIVLPDGPSPQLASASLIVHTARHLDRRSLTSQELAISRSIAAQVMREGRPISTTDAQGDSRFREHLSVHNLNLRSVICLPLRAAQGVLGALYLDHRWRINAFADLDVRVLAAFADQAAIALANARLVRQLAQREADLVQHQSTIDTLNQRLTKELEAERQALAHARARPHSHKAAIRHGMVGASPTLDLVHRTVSRVADKDVAVTILGESGTGKELVARAIHAQSQRSDKAFVCLNCGAIAAELLESELFGHERGAFTGAVRSKPGLVEVAHQGTLFLDEIGEMPLPMQVKLLRFLQVGEYRRVGGVDTHISRARIVAATHQPLAKMVETGRFREDLWYRLNVVEIHVPPLRERREDIPLLVAHFLEKHGGDKPPVLEREALAALLDFPWPGNIRELENEVQRAVLLAEGGRISMETLSPKLTRPTKAAKALAFPGTWRERLDAFEAETIREVLTASHGNVSAAARELGLTRPGLYKKLHKHGMVQSENKSFHMKREVNGN